MKLHRKFASRMACAAAMFAGTVFAQTAPEQFVVSGKNAEKIQDFTTINMATAERLAEVCEAAAAKEGVQISVIVLDNDGNQVYFDRMDGQGYLNIITADMKARTALMLRSPSKILMNNVIEDQTRELQYIQLNEFANSGGLPIVVNKQMIGAIGVGGSAPRVPVWSDEICAHRALTEVIGASVPPLEKDVPAKPNPNPANAPMPRFAVANPPKSTLSTPDWAISGKAASSVFDGNQLSLATAKKIAKVCRDFAAAKGFSTSIFILDTAGEYIHMERMDGQVFNNIRTALLKGQTALKMRQPTSAIGAGLRNNPSLIARQTTYFDLFTNSGGLPIVVDGQMVGAIGVGGMPGGNDEPCAIEGLKAAFGDHVTVPVYPAAAAR
ncbi:MAG: heme-binding protein [Bryobacteraceae bacterium]